MAIQIPQLKRIEPDQTPSVGRIEGVQLPDNTRNFQKTTGDLEQLSATAEDYQNRLQQQEADTVSRDVSNKFFEKAKAKYYGDPSTGEGGIRNLEGDPTVLYNDFNNQLKEEYKNSLKPEGDTSWSPVVQDAVEKRMSQKMSEIQLQLLSEYGSQWQKYTTKVHQADIHSQIGNLNNAATFIEPENPSTWEAYNETLGKMRNSILLHGMKLGSVVQDPNGVPISGDDGKLITDKDGKPILFNVGKSTDWELKKTLSDGVTESIQNLIHSGAPGSLEKSAALQQHYADIINFDAGNKHLNLTEHKKAMIDAQANDLLTQTNGMSAEQTSKIFDKAPPDVQKQAYINRESIDRSRQMMQERDQKNLYKRIATKILNVQSSDQPYADSNAMQKDQDIANLLPGLVDPELRQKVQALVDNPKTSSRSALVNYMNLVAGKDPQGKDIAKMDADEFSLYTANLGPADRRHAQAVFEKAHSSTGAQDMAAYRWANQELDKELVGNDIAKHNQYGKFSGRDEAIWLEAQQQLHRYLESSDHPMKPDEINQRVREYVQSYLTKKPLEPISAKQTFNGTGKTKVPPGSNILGSLTPASKFEYIKKWRAANKSTDTPSSAVLEEFISHDVSK